MKNCIKDWGKVKKFTYLDVIASGTNFLKSDENWKEFPLSNGTKLMKFIGQLSGGNQQKVIIARFLSNKPKIILLDEPTKGIDVDAKAEIFKILRSLIKDEGLSIIMVSSEIEEVISECDRVLILRNGKIAGEVEGESKTKEKILQYAFSG